MSGGVIADREPREVATAHTPFGDRAAGRPTPATTLRVLHLVNGEHFSGAESVQWHLGRCLPEWGVRADFACVKPGKFAEAFRQLRQPFARCFSVAMGHRFDPRPLWQIRRLIRDEGYDLLHAHTPRTALVAAAVCRLTGCPWVYHVHSPAGRDSARAWANQLNSRVERLSLRRCRHLICVSRSLREDYLRAGFASDRVTVVHNGVPAIRPPRRDVPQVWARWTLGMIALMRPRKGVEVALEALARVRAAGLDVRLRLIGPCETPEYEAEMRSRVRRLDVEGFVEWAGFTDDVPAALGTLDALVLPSLYGEGLPMVILEAMAAGIPVIGTWVEGIPEAIRDGIDGLLAEPRDPSSLADKIEALVTGRYDWSALAASAAGRHAELFSDRVMARQVAEVYRRCS